MQKSVEAAERKSKVKEKKAKVKSEKEEGKIRWMVDSHSSIIPMNFSAFWAVKLKLSAAGCCAEVARRGVGVFFKEVAEVGRLVESQLESQFFVAGFGE